MAANPVSDFALGPLTWVKMTIDADHTIVLHLDQFVELGTTVRA